MNKLGDGSMMPNSIVALATAVLIGLLPTDPSFLASAADVGVVCDPLYPGNTTRCTCAEGHDGCALPNCINQCTCVGGGCMMDTCLTSCICPEGGCTMSACISDCDNGDATEICDPGARCFEEGSTCAVGTETCCGKTHNSMECECERNDEQFLEYSCYYTDACMYPLCDRTDAPTPTPTVPAEVVEIPIGDAIIPPDATQAPVATLISPPPTEPPECSSGQPCFEEGTECGSGLDESCCCQQEDGAINCTNYDSLVCECAPNFADGSLEYVCMATDACMRPECQPGYTPPPSPEKGPPPSSSSIKILASWSIVGAFLGLL